MIERKYLEKFFWNEVQFVLKMKLCHMVRWKIKKVKNTVVEVDQLNGETVAKNLKYPLDWVGINGSNFWWSQLINIDPGVLDFDRKALHLTLRMKQLIYWDKSFLEWIISSNVNWDKIHMIWHSWTVFLGLCEMLGSKE